MYRTGHQFDPGHWLKMTHQLIGVYFLECKNGRYYVGSSKDIKKRLEEHQNGRVKATRYLLPVVLKAIIPCVNSTEAKKLEWKIKQAKSKMLIEKLIHKYRFSLHTKTTRVPQFIQTLLPLA